MSTPPTVRDEVELVAVVAVAHHSGEMQAQLRRHEADKNNGRRERESRVSRSVCRSRFSAHARLDRFDAFSVGLLKLLDNALGGLFVVTQTNEDGLEQDEVVGRVEVLDLSDRLPPVAEKAVEFSA